MRTPIVHGRPSAGAGRRQTTSREPGIRWSPLRPLRETFARYVLSERLREVQIRVLEWVVFPLLCVPTAAADLYTVVGTRSLVVALAVGVLYIVGVTAFGLAAGVYVERRGGHRLRVFRAQALVILTCAASVSLVKVVSGLEAGGIDDLMIVSLDMLVLTATSLLALHPQRRREVLSTIARRAGLRSSPRRRRSVGLGPLCTPVLPMFGLAPHFAQPVPITVEDRRFPSIRGP